MINFMKLSISEEYQSEMRHAYHDGAPGIFVSGLVWLAATFASFQLGVSQGVWTLLIGGALIHPLSSVLTRALGRPAKAAKGNPLEQLGMASTFWLILCCAMAYGLFLFKPGLFFPAMMATIGCRYLVFASLFGRTVFWVMGATLIGAGVAAFCLAAPPVLAAALGGTIEVLFAGFVFFKSRTSVPAVA
jgi:drug/metabolite transporter (DMT)-like permease